MVFPCLSHWIQRFPVKNAGLRSVLADGSNLTPLGHPKLGVSEFQPVDSMINWSKILKHSYTCVYIYIFIMYVYIYYILVIEYIFWLVVQSLLYFVEMALSSPFFRLAKPPTMTMDSFWLDPMRAFTHCNYNTVSSSICTASVTHRS